MFCVDVTAGTVPLKPDTYVTALTGGGHTAGLLADGVLLGVPLQHTHKNIPNVKVIFSSQKNETLLSGKAISGLSSRLTS